MTTPITCPIARRAADRLATGNPRDFWAAADILITESRDCPDCDAVDDRIRERGWPK